jgi:hypothetical protein
MSTQYQGLLSHALKAPALAKLAGIQIADCMGNLRCESIVECRVHTDDAMVFALVMHHDGLLRHGFLWFSVS